ncbi:transposase [Bacillus sp. ISL-7]|uniref:transposase n=1 Tax=Bacillus sp. ISL-7 TaxID=2819136 RepID=UPI0035A87D37
MFKPRVSTQSEYEFVSIDELVPDNHLLRLIDKYIDLSFLFEKVRPYYSDDNGRPSNPTILFKMMFIGYIYGIRSERQLQREIETYRTTNRECYKEYKTDSKKCENCPLLSQCTRSKNIFLVLLPNMTCHYFYLGKGKSLI